MMCFVNIYSNYCFLINVRLKELKMSSLLKELVLYILFVVCLSVVTYNNKNPMAFQVNQAMTDILVHRADNEGKSFDTVTNNITIIMVDMVLDITLGSKS